MIYISLSFHVAWKFLLFKINCETNLSFTKYIFSVPSEKWVWIGKYMSWQVHPSKTSNHIGLMNSHPSNRWLVRSHQLTKGLTGQRSRLELVVQKQAFLRIKFHGTLASPKERTSESYEMQPGHHITGEKSMWKENSFGSPQNSVVTFRAQKLSLRSFRFI